jgi:glycerol-1-phosphate dehydrogenase [NAD(P)+]
MKRIWSLPTVELKAYRDIDEARAVGLVTSAPAWNAVSGQLGHLHVASHMEVTEATTQHWEAVARGSLAKDRCEVIYAVGGGLAADAAKYIARQFGLPMVCLPTALSVDAFLTAASGIRRDGCVTYIETKPPETLILDLDVIAAAPPSIRSAGITDLLSIATGCWDWRFAHERGRNPPGMEFIPFVHDIAQSILQGALDCAEAAGRGDPQGLKQLYDCLALEVQLCNQIGHARPEEGSEHYFAYCVENLVGPGLPHGDLVGPGILIIARLQGRASAPLEKALADGNVPLTGLSAETIQRTLDLLPEYCRRHGLAFGIAHTMDGSS